MQIAPGGTRYALLALAVAVPAVFITGWLSVVFIGLAVFTLWFFRDPERSPPPAGIVSPADGTVMTIDEQDGQVRLGIFMGLTDVHVTRVPLDGRVLDVEHRLSANRPAFSKASERNERLVIDFDSFRVALIAGWFARRISPYVSPGDEMTRGDRLGHIAFGSRVDIHLPTELDVGDLTVQEGDSVQAGESVIAQAPAPAR